MKNPSYYLIRVHAILDPSWTDWFDGMSITPYFEESETVLFGAVPDQAALHGILNRIRDLNLTLITVQLGPPTPSPNQPTG